MPACGACGSEIAADAAFCSACGAPRTGTADGQPREERKRVSVVFADLVGFTTHSEALDPEDVRALLRPYHALLRAELERHGGTVEKFIGDAVAAVFGAPAAHEDDPERAVRAALAIRDRIAAGGELHVRIGVTTGVALVSLDARPEAGEGIAAGDVVNTAARLQTAAPVDAVVVDEETYRATRRRVRYREQPAVALKGKAEAVRVWEAVEPAAPRPADARDFAQAPFIGRRSEVAALLSALEETGARGRALLVTVVGEPGIGKTRLVSELARRVPAAVAWRREASLPYGQGAYGALAGIVSQEAGLEASDDAATAERKVFAAVARAVPERDREWVAGQLLRLVRPPGRAETAVSGDERAEAFAAWRRFFEARGEQGQVVLVFEDVHWADDGLLDFVEHLVEWAVRTPLLVVATARPELLSRRTDWGRPGTRTTLLTLEPLSGPESAELVDVLMEGRSRGPELRSAVLAQAAGNPLYAEEFARLALERADVRGLPETVRGIIGARIDALPAAEKRLLQDAAVVGRVFWSGVLSLMTGVGRWAIEERLHDLERRGFVRRVEGSAVADETEYAFRHELIRDAAYDQLPRRERMARHEAAARWYEESGRADADALAHHLEAALRLGAALSEPVERLELRAAGAHILAGDRAYTLNAFARAAEHYERALALPLDPVARADILLKHGRSLSALGDRHADAMLKQAAEALLAAGAPEAAAEAHIDLAHRYRNEVQPDRVDAHLAAAGSLLGSDRSSSVAARLLATRAHFMIFDGDLEGGLPLAEEALALAEATGQDDLRARLLDAAISWSKWTRGLPGWREDLERALEIALSANSPVAASAANNLAASVYDSGDVGASAGLHAEAVRLAERFGRGDMIWFLRGWRPCIDVALGSWDEAVTTADAFILDCEAGARSYAEVWARGERALVRFARDDVAGALADLERAVALGREKPSPMVFDWALHRAAWIWSEAGRIEAARAALDEVLAEPGGVHRGFAFGFADLAWAGRRLSRSEEVRARLAGGHREGAWFEAARAIAAGDLAAAASRFESGGAVSRAAYARLRAGEQLVAGERFDEATRQLERALAFFRGVDATRYVREAETLMATATSDRVP